MSEAELHWLHSRLTGGKMKKAESGQLRITLPTGLVYDNAGKIVLDPDEEVQQAVHLVFATFQELGSAQRVVRYFKEQGLRFPTRELRGPQKGDLSWGRLAHSRVLHVLHNPLYAGAYAYGRTKLLFQRQPGETRPTKQRTRRRSPEDWEVLLLDVHPGYINWEQYLRNQQRLDDNRSDRENRPGAAREGAALLQGIAICGHCGLKMTIRYRDDGKTVIYNCQFAFRQYSEPVCQSIQGKWVDAEVAELFLAAMNPAELQRVTGRAGAGRSPHPANRTAMAVAHRTSQLRG